MRLAASVAREADVHDGADPLQVGPRVRPVVPGPASHRLIIYGFSFASPLFCFFVYSRPSQRRFVFSRCIASPRRPSLCPAFTLTFPEFSPVRFALLFRFIVDKLVFHWPSQYSSSVFASVTASACAVAARHSHLSRRASSTCPIASTA